MNKTEKILDEVFKSLQLMNYYELYYDFDFSVKKLKNFNNMLAKVNEEMNRNKVDIYTDKLKNNIGFDCYHEAKVFPLRPKINISGIRPKELYTQQPLIDFTIATYLCVAIKVMRESYRFNSKQIRLWWDKMREFSYLYSKGLTNEDLKTYFGQECDLPIFEDN